MPLKCFVPGCDTGMLTDRKRLQNEGKKYPSIFHPTEVIDK